MKEKLLRTSVAAFSKPSSGSSPGSHQAEAGLPDGGGERTGQAACDGDTAAGDPLHHRAEPGSVFRAGRHGEGRVGWAGRGHQLHRRGPARQRSGWVSVCFKRSYPTPPIHSFSVI